MQTLTNLTNLTKSPTPPPMRGIKQAIAEIKAADKNTALTEKALRRLILNHEIPSVKIGRKYLVNMIVLNNYLTSGTLAINPQDSNMFEVPHISKIQA